MLRKAAAEDLVQFCLIRARLRREDAAQPPINLLRPYDADLMKAWKVDARVGNVRNDDSTLCEVL